MDILVSILSFGFLHTKTNLPRDHTPRNQDRLCGKSALPRYTHSLCIVLLMFWVRRFKKFHPTDPNSSYPTVTHDEVMIDNKAVFDWLEKIVGPLQPLLMLTGSSNADIFLVRLGILLCRGRSCWTWGNTKTDREDCLCQTYPLWYDPSTIDYMSAIAYNTLKVASGISQQT